MNKTINGFLEVLQTVTQANLDFNNGLKPSLHFNDEEYEEEMEEIRDLINSFNFVRSED